MALIKFHIPYVTNFGEEVFICGSTAEIGNFDESKAKRLNHTAEIWTAEIDVKNSGIIRYYYLIKENGITTRQEWGESRRLQVVKSKDFHVVDFWKERPFHGFLYSSLFADTIFAHPQSSKPFRYSKESILLNVQCPFVRKGQKLLLSGDAEKLGKWDLKKSPALDYFGNGEWQILLNRKDLPEIAQYKFVIADDNNNAIHWEDGDNRFLDSRKFESKNGVYAENGLIFRHHSFLFKGVGTAIPVFSLRSKESFGIGDFADLRKFVDWAEKANQQIIQILPINDTTTSRTWTDSYPYNAISCYALHPIYLGLSEFPLKSKIRMKAFLKEAQELNKSDKLDYEKVLDLKSRYSKLLFAQEKNTVLKSKPFLDFAHKNNSWLFSYTAYCYLRDKFNTSDFNEWEDFATYDESKLQNLVSKNSEANETTSYYAYLQFLLDSQLSEVRRYASGKGVGLKGDIPIGINRDSIEAWKETHLFNMDTQTGAPPDDFSVFGQNWGFPTYNWKMMEQENYDWWKNRFKKMADYFDAYRIDHILGFFRIWEIPLHSVQGLLGHFSPALPYWPEELKMFGIPFDEERMTKPFIHESFLADIFGEYTDEVKNNFLETMEWHRFKLKSKFDTQRKIQRYFHGKTDEKELKIRDGLYALCNEVLFVRDRISHNRFHPRITAHATRSFQFLDESTKSAYYKLYEDFFYRKHNYFWREQAMEKLPPLISSTSMLVCGEDLGMVPDCVPSVMHELQILSLEIQRMPKDFNVAFSNLATLPYLSVCTTSTHDMPPIRLWWEENREITQNYYNHVLQHPGEAPQKCSAELCRQIIQLHLDSSAMWIILPWQDWMAISQKDSNPDPAEERINIPSNPRHYWRYRMHMTIEELMDKEELNNDLRAMSRR